MAGDRIRLSSDNKSYLVGDHAYPRMTRIIEVGAPKTYLDKWRREVGVEEAQRILQTTGEAGTLIHLALEYNDKRPDPAAQWNLQHLVGCDGWLLPYVMAWRVWCKAAVQEWLWIERFLYSEEYEIAGCTDRLGIIKYDVNSTVVDFKSTSGIHKDTVAIQGIGYLKMARETIERERLTIPMPTRVLIVNLPGPRENKDNVVKEPKTWGFRMGTEEWEMYEEMFNQCLHQYRVMTE